MSSDAFKAQLEKFNAEYRAALPGKLAEIDALWARAGGMNGDEVALVDLHRLLHTLAGSAKTFGLASVSTAAREAETALSPHVSGGAALDAAGRTRIAALLETLRQSAPAP